MFTGVYLYISVIEAKHLKRVTNTLSFDTYVKVRVVFSLNI